MQDDSVGAVQNGVAHACAFEKKKKKKTIINLIACYVRLHF